MNIATKLLACIVILCSCRTVKEANFDEDYLQHYKESYTVEIPEQYELVKVMVALTDCGQVDDNMVDLGTEYHQDVMDYFGPYQEHKLIRKMERKIRKPMKLFTYINYLMYRNNALAYKLDENGEIVLNYQLPQSRMLFWGDPIKKNRKLINDFVDQTSFREFYQDHMPFYLQQIDIYEQKLPVDDMIDWLAARFPGIDYSNYRIIISPLVYGTHYTRNYSSNGLDQTIMSVAPYVVEDGEDQISEDIENQRILFTEIDHNFVNVVSDRFIKRIDEVFKDLDFWRTKSDATKGYNNSYKTFNEYMTWAVFSLYCMDRYAEADYNAALVEMEEFMQQDRDFIRFSEFNQALMKFYSQNREIEIDDLYNQILDWCEKRQKDFS